jgi:hypothetical protein
MTYVDRLNGINSGLGFKAPVRAATTANITLSGTQTIDGVALVAGDRVLVKDQTTTSDNGIWNVSSGNWTRAKDFDGARDLVRGTRVAVAEGSVNGLTTWHVNTSSPMPGSALAFIKVSESYFNVKSFGAKGDGTTDDSAAIILANATAAAARVPLHWPAGTYIAANIPILSYSTWIGEGMDLVTIKLKSGTNGGLVTCAGMANNVTIKDMTFDGNYNNNTGTSTILVEVEGHKPELTNLRFQYAAGTALYTDYDIDPLWVGGALGRFQNLVFDSIKGSGWIHRGPNDSSIEQIYMVDIGTAANNTYYGLALTVTGYIYGGGNCRINGFHHNNRDGTTNTPIAGLYIAAGVGGCTITNSHFEGGVIPLRIDGTVNTISSSLFYAPRGDYCVVLNGGGNLIHGVILNTAASPNPDFKGIDLNSEQNFIDVFTGGPTEGNIDFTNTLGRNVVRMVGNSGAGVPLYLGTPAASDEVYINVAGPANGFFIQRAGYAWTAYTPTVTAQGGVLDFTPGTGTDPDIAATGRYKLDGKTLHLQVEIPVVDVGTGTPTGVLYVSLPASKTAAANGTGHCMEVNNGVTGGAFYSAGGTTVGFVKPDGTTYFGNGNTIWCTMVIEVQ